MHFETFLMMCVLFLLHKSMRFVLDINASGLINEMVVFFRGISITLVIALGALVGVGCFTTGAVMELDSL